MNQVYQNILKIKNKIDCIDETIKSVRSTDIIINDYSSRQTE